MRIKTKLNVACWINVAVLVSIAIVAAYENKGENSTLVWGAIIISVVLGLGNIVGVFLLGQKMFRKVDKVNGLINLFAKGNFCP